jgi:hypothetical protein
MWPLIRRGGLQVNVRHSCIGRKGTVRVPVVQVFRDNDNSFSTNRISKSSSVSFSSKSPPQTQMGTQNVQQTTNLLHNAPWTSKHWKLARSTLTSSSKLKPTPQSVDRSFQLLDRMIIEAERPGINIHISTQLLNQVLDHWRIGSRYQVVDPAKWPAQRVLALLDNYTTRVPSSLAANTKTYSLIAAVAIKQTPSSAPEFCSALLERMKQSTHARPNAVILTQIMDAYVKSGQPQAPMAAQALFDYMVESSRIAPNEKSLTRVLQAWITNDENDNHEEALTHINQALGYMIHASKNHPAVLPNSLFLVLVLDACLAKQRQQQNAAVKSLAPLLADALMTRVCLDAITYPRLAPTEAAYSSLVTLWAKSHHMSQSPERAEFWLGRMRLASEENSAVTPPRGNLYSVVISAWEKSGRPEAAHRGEILWKHLILERADSDDNLPDVETFNSVLDSLAKSDNPKKGQHAETVLIRMQELSDKGHFDKPNFGTFQKVIHCWAESDMDGAAERAEDVLRLAEGLFEAGDLELRPTFDGYMSVIGVLSKSYSQDAPERIQLLLQRIEQRFESGDNEFQLDERAYISLISAYAHSGRDDATQRSQTVFDESPSRIRSTGLYNVLILAQGGDSNRAEVLLQDMHRAFLEGNDQVKPDITSFNNVILSWSKSGSPMAAWRVDSIFHRMTELSQSGLLAVKPNGKTFELVITTLSNDWGADSAAKVDCYLELLKGFYRSGKHDCSPSVISYTEAIRAWGSNVEDPRAVLRAKALLDEMHELAREGVDTVKPNSRTYMVYLKALAVSSVPDKISLAKEAVHSMKQNDIEPDAVLLAQIQRCLVPIRVSSNPWTVILHDSTEFPPFMVPSEVSILSSVFHEE